MQFQSRLAFIIPTVNRPNELRRLLESMESQSALPDETIIVDAGSSSLDRVLRDFSRLNIKYVHLSPPGLTKQKNAGIKALNDRITLAGYLDDDLVMDPGATEAMLRFWDGAPADVGGAAFNISN